MAHASTITRDQAWELFTTYNKDPFHIQQGPGAAAEGRGGGDVRRHIALQIKQLLDIQKKPGANGDNSQAGTLGYPLFLRYIWGMEAHMKNLEYTYWKDGEFFLGYLNDYPDHMTQGKTLKELEEMLKSLYADFSANTDGVKQRGTLIVA